MKKKIVIIQNEIPHYRIGFYNELSKIYDLTVAHSGAINNSSEKLFDEVALKLYKFGPFYYQKGLGSYLKTHHFEALIIMFDIRWVSNIMMLFTKHPNKILWGHRYSGNKAANKLRNYLMKFAHAHILYSKCEVDKMIKANISKEAIFIAHNTMLVSNSSIRDDFNNMNSLLFVGRAQKRKRIDLLLTAFSEIKDLIPGDITIDIIGAGKENELIKKKAIDIGLENRVKFHGKITDAAILKTFFHKAIAYVSPGPVGLGVLHSLAYGVPVITFRKGHHGPEFSNIIHNNNGIICENYGQLKTALIEICNDLIFAKKIGINAYNHFNKNRSLEIMSQGFMKAIEYNKNGKIL